MKSPVLKLAIPSIISNITVPLLGLVDVTITGHMGDARYMAAIAVGSMVFNILCWLFSFLRFGTGGMTAQAYGRMVKQDSDMSEVSYILFRSVLTSLLIALSLLVLQEPLYRLVVWFVEPEQRILGALHTYYSICIWMLPASLSLYTFTGWFVGMQNTRLPMLISIMQNVANICLSCFFVYVMGMKIEGVALGTLLAAWLGAMGAILLIRRRYRPRLQIDQPWYRFLLQTIRSIIIPQRKGNAVNYTLFLRTLFLIAVNLFFIEAGARGGTVTLAVNSVLMQLFILYTYVMDGFAFAAEALCGRYYGAADRTMFRSSVKSAWRWAVALTAVYTVAYAFGSEQFLHLLTDDTTVRSAATEYLPWAVLIPVCGVAAFVWDGVFIGMTRTLGMMWGTLSGAAAFFIIYLTLYSTMHNHALWLAFNAYLLLRGITQTMLCLHYMK